MSGQRVVSPEAHSMLEELRAQRLSLTRVSWAIYHLSFGRLTDANALAALQSVNLLASQVLRWNGAPGLSARLQENMPAGLFELQSDFPLWI